MSHMISSFASFEVVSIADMIIEVRRNFPVIIVLTDVNIILF